MIGEELGLVGATATLVCFCLIAWRGLRISLRAQDSFGAFVALGMTTMIVVQAFVNMSVVLGLMPTKGIPLPGERRRLIAHGQPDRDGRVAEHFATRDGSRVTDVDAGIGADCGRRNRRSPVSRDRRCPRDFRSRARRAGHVVGTAAGLEARVIPREGFALDVIRSAGLKGKSIGPLLRGLALLPASAADAWNVVRRRHPSVVVGVGGYSSGPVVLIAALRGIPTLLLEQNAMPGMTNRLLAPVVDAAAITYEESVRFFGDKAFVSGNPVRPEFFRKEGAHGDDVCRQGRRGF